MAQQSKLLGRNGVKEICVRPSLLVSVFSSILKLVKAHWHEWPFQPQKPPLRALSWKSPGWRSKQQTMFCNSLYLLLKTRHDASHHVSWGRARSPKCLSWCRSHCASAASPILAPPPPHIIARQGLLCAVVAAHVLPAGNHDAVDAGGGVGGLPAPEHTAEDEASEHSGFERHGVADTTKKMPLSGLRKHFPKQLWENIKMLENDTKFQAQTERANFCSFQI